MFIFIFVEVLGLNGGGGGIGCGGIVIVGVAVIWRGSLGFFGAGGDMASDGGRICELVGCVGGVIVGVGSDGGGVGVH